MRILQISYRDIAGGAEQVALALHKEYLRQGHESALLVGTKCTSSVPGVTGLSKGNSFWWKVVNRLLRDFEYYTGIQGTFSPLFRRWFKRNHENWDIIHCHNLHRGYFALSNLRLLANLYPVVMTLHDEWLYTGHCACTLGCEQWLHGCGNCPNLETLPPVRVDRTATNSQARASLLKEVNPTLVAPSRWLAQNVERSRLNMHCNVIPNGIDVNKYVPISKAVARENLGLPNKSTLLLNVVNGGLLNKFRDAETLLQALRIVRSKHNEGDVKLVVAGGYGGVPDDLRDSVIEVGKIIEGLNQYYSAADVLVHSTKSESFSLVAVEAMACGTPVVISDVGACSEVVLDGVTGFLVKSGDPKKLAETVCAVLNGNTEEMVKAGLKRVKSNFSLEKMAERYIELYQKCIEKRSSSLKNVQ